MPEQPDDTGVERGGMTGDDLDLDVDLDLDADSEEAAKVTGGVVAPCDNRER